MSREVLLIPHNHFDPTWRRCFDRPAVYHGVTVRSYAEIEALCFDAWLALAPRGYTYFEGQTAVLRKYLERRPEAREALQRHARAGLLELEYSAFSVDGRPDLSLVIYNPATKRDAERIRGLVRKLGKTKRGR